MLPFGITLLGVTMFAHGWWQAGVTEPKPTGWLAAVVGVALAAAVLAPAAIFGTVAVAEGTLLLTWAIYAFLLAGLCLQEHGTRETGTRTFAFYSIWLAVASLFFLAWFVAHFSLAGIIATGVLAAACVLLFLHMVGPIRSLGPFAAWVFIGAGVIVSAVGLSAILGFIR